MRVSSLILGAAALIAVTLGGAPSAHAILLWGNNAGSNAVIEAFDPVTGAVVHQYSVAAGQNGRGVVVVGNTVYYTVVGDGNLFKIDANTGLSLGSVPTGQSSLSTIAFDGTNFYLGDYSGTGRVYHFDLASQLVDRSFLLGNCGGNCDGLEYFKVGGQERLISNRGDSGGPYDVYDINGVLVTANFITQIDNSGHTGIAFDGTDFFVSNLSSNSVSVFDSTGAFVRTTTLGAPSPASGFGRLLEDLAFDANVVIGVPEPASMTLLGMGLLGLGLFRRRRT